MKSKKLMYFTFLFCVCNVIAYAKEANVSPCQLKQEMRNMMKNIIKDNESFRNDPRYDEAFFRKLAAGQSPRVTVVACSDSRVHTSNFDFHPMGDVFFIRNIGNQIETCLGSVDYGVLHAKTPLLLFLGHSNCGAITAVTEGTPGLEESIVEELETISITHKTSQYTAEQLAENIEENVHRQVYKACERYQDRISCETLWVVGAIYDFTPEGKGELKILQVNNRTDEHFIHDFIEDVMKVGDYYDDPGRVPSERIPSDS